MTLNQEKKQQEKPKNQCVYCMGFTFFASNPNNWMLNTCDSCGLFTRVKAEQRADADSEKVSNPLPSKYSQTMKQEAQEPRGFWKTVEKVLVALSA